MLSSLHSIPEVRTGLMIREKNPQSWYIDENHHVSMLQDDLLINIFIPSSLPLE